MAASNAQLRSGSGLPLTAEELDELFRHAEKVVRADRRPLVSEAMDILYDRIYDTYTGRRCFDQLVTAGCDKDDLLWRLAMCSEPPSKGDVYGEICGLEARDLKSLPKQWNKVAKQIDKINAAAVGTLFEVAGIPSPTILAQGLRNLGWLLAFAGKLRSRTYWVIAKKRLIDYVEKQTGALHDPEVAELIATITANENYTAHAHAAWRKRNDRPSAAPNHSGTMKTDTVPIADSRNMSLRLVGERTVVTAFILCEYARLKKLLMSKEADAKKLITRPASRNKVQ